MVVPFQGFQIDKNLSESVNDRDILNNIGDFPIADDLLRFKNNKRNVSTLTVNINNITGNKILFTGDSTVFSNNTKIKINNNDYFVLKSNGINEFSISPTLNEADIVVPLVGTYIRSDEVTKENIQFFSIERKPTSINQFNEGINLGLTNTSFENYYLQNTTQKRALENIEDNINIFKFRQEKSLTIDNNFLSTNNNSLRGYIIIEDIDGANNLSLTNSGPGLFVYNPITQTGVRAFSSNDNPWSDNATSLVTTSSKITVGNLRFAINDIEIIEKSGSNLIENFSSNTNTTTHKLKTEINGEEYFILITQV